MQKPFSVEAEATQLLTKYSTLSTRVKFIIAEVKVDEKYTWANNEENLGPLQRAQSALVNHDMHEIINKLVTVGNAKDLKARSSLQEHEFLMRLAEGISTWKPLILRVEDEMELLADGAKKPAISLTNSAKTYARSTFFSVCVCTVGGLS